MMTLRQPLFALATITFLAACSVPSDAVDTDTSSSSTTVGTGGETEAESGATGNSSGASTSDTGRTNGSGTEESSSSSGSSSSVESSGSAESSGSTESSTTEASSDTGDAATADLSVDYVFGSDAAATCEQSGATWLLIEVRDAQGTIVATTAPDGSDALCTDMPFVFPDLPLETYRIFVAAWDQELWTSTDVEHVHGDPGGTEVIVPLDMVPSP